MAGIISFDTVAVTPARIARVILKTFLLPLGMGMLLRLAAPTLSERIGEPLLKISGAIMGLFALAVLLAGFHSVFEVGLPSILGPICKLPITLRLYLDIIS